MKDKIQVLERAFHVLELVAQDTERPHTVGELAEMSGLKVQTLSKIVRTMTVLGYLENTGRKSGYIIGEKLLRLAESYRDPDTLRRLVQPHLKFYAEQIGEYICFSVLRGYYKRIVCKIRAKEANPRFQYTFPAEENAFESLSGICLVARSGSFGSGHGGKAVLLGQLVVGTAGALAHDDLHAGVAQVLGMGMALAAVTDDGLSLVF